MAITREEVLHIARLARLDLTPEDIERFTVQLNTILQHVAELEQVDVSGVSEVGAIVDGAVALRDDVVEPTPLSAPVEQLSEHFTAGFFTVPRLPAMSGEE